MAQETRLKNKPLVEAIFELRWELQEVAPGISVDPAYKLLIGRLYDRVRQKFPFHESAPAVLMPDEMSAYAVQHRFRKAQGEWPLIQIGPGVITLNDTEGYTWTEFRTGISNTIKVLFEAYPEAESKLSVNRILLRYIDAVDFDFKENVLQFLKYKMKTTIEFAGKLFKIAAVSSLPVHLDLRFSFPAGQMPGNLHLRFVRGQRKGQDALLWETIVESVEPNVPKREQDIMDWIDKSHDVVHNFFFGMIEGELQERFQ